MLRYATTGAALVLATLIQVSPAQAQTYPSRQITIMPLLAAGTGLDTVVRLYSEHLSQAFGRTMVIDNRPGNAGLVGVAALKAAPADGHTLMVATSAVMAIRPSLLKERSYDPVKDFVPLALYVKSPFILVVNPATPVRSVPELIKYVKERPGKLSYSSPSAGGAPHLAVEYMKQRFGLDIVHVPYKNSPQSIADVAAGHIDLAFAEAGVSLPLIRADKLRALAVSSATRLPTVPDIPTFGGNGERSRFRGGVVARPGGARGHAAGYRRAAARRDEADHGDPGGEQEGGLGRPDPDRNRLDRRHARLHQVRRREMGRTGEEPRPRRHNVAGLRAFTLS